MHKKLLLSVFTLALTGAVIHSEELNAKSAPPVTQVNVNQVNVSPEMIKYAVTGERRAIFTAAMEDLLKDPTAKSNFWDIYNAYEKERASVMDSRMNIVSEYAKNFLTMSDMKVKELLKDSYKVQSKDISIRKKYAGQLAKKVNATVAGRFWQVDDFITSAVKVSILSSVPLLGEDIK
ncbi:MAG: hypothetical protein IPN90_09895 [Elusimicrobia bacterium]|nr:hypothetical protein [Elusimicrobiota bacterium]